MSAGWIVIGVCAAVYVAVLVVLALAIRHARRAAAPERGPETHRRHVRVVGAAVGATIVILFAFLFLDFFTSRGLAEVGAGASRPLTIVVTGHQWWWQVTYEDTAVSARFSTANEIHIPVGRPVMLKLLSRDVIHSFWVPNLAGKRDLIPPYTNVLWLRADRPGIYRGQCAEFCGLQHAKMDFLVVAEPPERFAAWVANQRSPGRSPADPVTRHGQAVFLGSACILCHTIVGTPANGRVGPDLTHVGGRATLAAGVLPNTRGNLAGWIADPQRVKPGAKMPPNILAPRDLQAVVAYLASLQ
ncbi:MAG: cytochrome c oxidase subunit II [Gemmatimonadetes bacterium]|nr:cytochrome c oxidase subunit II [Gemmatimonadota bacterium]